MKKGIKIVVGLTMGAVVFYIVYLLFLKKDSKIYVLNGSSNETDTTGDDVDN